MLLPRKLALYLTFILLIIDLVLVSSFLWTPQRDRVNGGLGQSLMMLYILGGMAILVLYGIIFYVAHSRQMKILFQAFAWFALFFNAFILLGIIRTMI